jgi:hypothetical protein
MAAGGRARDGEAGVLRALYPRLRNRRQAAGGEGLT